MGIPHLAAKGGPPTHLPYLVEYFRSHSGYTIKTFYYGSKNFGTVKGESETVFKKIIQTLINLITYLYYIIVYRPDIVHLNSAFDFIALLRDVPFSLLSLVMRRNLIIKLHGSKYDLLMTKNRFKRLLVKFMFTGASCIGVLSDVERDEFIQQYGFKDKIIVVKNIIPSKTLNAKNEYFDRKKYECYGLFVSRIDEKKGLADLIMAVPEILKNKPSFKLVIAGDGPERENCENLADNLGVSSHLNWLGYVESINILTLYSQSDVFVFPTHYPEGMPMALVDALIVGVPIVTTRVRFASSYLKDMVNCLFVDKARPKQIANAVIHVLNDTDLQNSMSKMNPKLLYGFSKKQVGGEFCAIYMKMLSEK